MNELKTYFGITENQAQLAAQGWTTIYWSKADTLYKLPPTKYYDVQGMAYYQWALSYYTRALGMGDSVAFSSATVVGYPEMYYFYNYEFLKAVNGTNYYNQFANITYVYNISDKHANLEDLFNLTDGNGNAPGPSSLFNLNTLKSLIALGQSVPDIVADPSV